jgi:large subunit ribosomal protein L22
MPGPKTNERAARDPSTFGGTRAVLRHARVSPSKVREVLDLVRGRPVHEAEDILRFSERDAAFTVGKVLQSAVANAQNNDELDPEELYVSSCFADEGSTIKRWRPRARGRATRIRKRTCHITVIVSRLPEDELQRLQAHRRAEQLARRARRVSGSRRQDDTRNRAARRRNEPIPEETPAEEPAAAPAGTAIESPAGAATEAGAEGDTATDTGEAAESADPAVEAEPAAAAEPAVEAELAVEAEPAAADEEGEQVTEEAAGDEAAEGEES